MHERTHLDKGLIQDLMPFTVQDYESLRYTNDRTLKDAFIAGDIREPSLRYGDVEVLNIPALLEDLGDFEKVVLAYDHNTVRRAYTAKVEELRHKYALLEAAGTGNDVAARDASIALYGAPQQDYFAYTLRDLEARLNRVEEAYPNDDRVRHAVSMLRPLIVADRAATYPWDSIALPGIREYEDVRGLSAAEIRTACKRAFAEYGIEGWHAVIDAPGERVTFNTNQGLRTVFIPSDEDMRTRKYPLTRERVEALIAHEIGIHVLRRENGDKSPLALLGVGLAGYLRAEEGIATYTEQLHGGTRHFAGGLGYMAVAWALGLDGTPRTFRGLFEVLVPYMLVSSLEHGLIYDEDVDLGVLEQRVVRNAWARCVRVFRGTTGNTPGCCFTKDVVYLEGNIAIWQLVTENPAWADKFTLGKYDPTNPEHVGILQELGML